MAVIILMVHHRNLFRRRTKAFWTNVWRYLCDKVFRLLSAILEETYCWVICTIDNVWCIFAPPFSQAFRKEQSRLPHGFLLVFQVDFQKRLHISQDFEEKLYPGGLWAGWWWPGACLQLWESAEGHRQQLDAGLLGGGALDWGKMGPGKRKEQRDEVREGTATHITLW